FLPARFRRSRTSCMATGTTSSCTIRSSIARSEAATMSRCCPSGPEAAVVSGRPSDTAAETAAPHSFLSRARTSLDQEADDAVDLQRPRRVERRAAVGVGGVHVDAEAGEQGDRIEYQRLTLAAIYIDPGFAAAHSHRRHQRRRHVRAVLEVGAAGAVDDA